ncbi:hypothetical protein DPEC_G00352390 [Dallia pectoralis]|uniref:Uncharacterized protein n=1 Tax=Dallia pectoralis TaxID=75939 RepID=A0ACC2F2B1_DALPE|nr:hypothetical protein DPEC_G00352390 [Dallia pectoralis]
MATAPARRKHGACLLRIRENCPFRKLRKNRGYDLTPSTSACDGACWRDFSELSTSTNRPISTFVDPPTPSYQSVLPSQSQDPMAMDTEVIRLPSPAMDVTSLTASGLLPPGPPVPNLQAAGQHRDVPTAPPSELRMELDSGVDPETGERAQD